MSKTVFFVPIVHTKEYLSTKFHLNIEGELEHHDGDGYSYGLADYFINRTNGHYLTWLNGCIYIYKAVWILATGYSGNINHLKLEHIDGNKDNNRLDNLRLIN